MNVLSTLPTVVCVLQCMLTCIAEQHQSLRLVNVAYRHGARTAVNLFPKDTNTEDTWPEGLGELTKIGIEQEYDLGEFMRETYTDKQSFMSSSYRHNEIYVQSTDVNRCIMSAQGVLSGMYPPAGDQLWNEDIHWQPIPVHTVPAEFDQIFSKVSCPKLEEIESMPASEMDYRYIKENYGKLLAHIHEQAGFTNWTMNATNLFGYIRDIRDTLFVEKEEGRQTPEWANDTVMSILNDQIDSLTIYMRLKHPEGRRLRAGALLYKMISDMKMKKEGNLDANMKMFMYSGHDSTIRPLLAVLDVLDNRTIPYSSAVMLELHEEDSSKPGKYFVRLWLRLGSQQNRTQLKIPGCDKMDCDFDVFINITEPMTVRDRYRECQVNTWFGLTTYRGVAIAACVSSAIAAFLLIVTCTVCCCYKCKACRRPRTIRKYHVHEMGLPEELPMINSNLSDED